jgi:hypothetical protein
MRSCETHSPPSGGRGDPLAPLRLSSFVLVLVTSPASFLLLGTVEYVRAYSSAGAVSALALPWFAAAFRSCVGSGSPGGRSESFAGAVAAFTIRSSSSSSISRWGCACCGALAESSLAQSRRTSVLICRYRCMQLGLSAHLPKHNILPRDCVVQRLCK